MTPLDIKKQIFARKLRGFDPGQVQAFLETAGREFEELNRKNAHLQELLNASEQRVHQYTLIEKTLQDTAITLQQTLEEKRKTAEMEANLILHEGRKRAEEESLASRERGATLRVEIQRLEDRKRELFLRMRNLLEGQMQALEALAGDAIPTT